MASSGERKNQKQNQQEVENKTLAASFQNLSVTPEEICIRGDYRCKCGLKFAKPRKLFFKFIKFI